MEDKRRRRYISAGVILIIGVIIFFILNVCIGSINIPLNGVIKALSGGGEENYRLIIWDIRLPRTCAALILGGALALSGYLLQTFFHNPLAGPFVLGISSGAKMTVAIAMIYMMGRSIKMTSASLIIAGFVGAMLAMGFVLVMSDKVNSKSMLVVSGVMIGYICSAITDLIVNFADDADIVNLHNWSQGSFSGMTWEKVRVMTVVVLITAIVVFLLSKPLSAYQLGDVYAINSGVNIKKLRVLLVILSGILSACVVAFAGPISFIGIATPHLVKKLIKTSKPVIMIPFCFVGGSMFCMLCDLIARSLFSPSELSISTVTAILGAPVVLIILADKKREL